jgi:thiamine-phosphate pyrophosphorylase
LPPGRKPIFCYVTDGRAFETAPVPSDSLSSEPGLLRGQSLRDSIWRAAAVGAGWIQIREKDLDARALVELARFAVAETRAAGARVLVNDRLDVALAANAAGVHLGEKSLPLETVIEWRRSAGRLDFLIGVSCHSLESARSAGRGGADYILFGPVFATPSKAAFGAPQGIDRLREVCASVEVPVVAIGGVNLENARACIAAGAAGVAAIRLFQDAKNEAELACSCAGNVAATTENRQAEACPTKPTRRPNFSASREGRTCPDPIPLLSNARGFLLPLRVALRTDGQPPARPAAGPRRCRRRRPQ